MPWKEELGGGASRQRSNKCKGPEVGMHQGGRGARAERARGGDLGVVS